LVEIMVALVAGLIMMAGVIQIFVANKQTYRVNEAEARIQENARIAMELLGRQIRMVGYRNDPSKSFSAAFPNVRFAGYLFNDGEVIRGTDNEVVLRYEADGLIRDCGEGSKPPAGSVVINTRLYVDGAELKCQTEVGTQPLLSDVAAMIIRYGIDSDGDGTANRYDRADGVSDWSQVVSLRLTLTFESAGANTSVTSGKRLQKTYTATFGLRNLLP
jgi:type IV pilus assembly protein PilW